MIHWFLLTVNRFAKRMSGQTVNAIVFFAAWTICMEFKTICWNGSNFGNHISPFFPLLIRFRLDTFTCETKALHLLFHGALFGATKSIDWFRHLRILHFVFVVHLALTMIYHFSCEIVRFRWFSHFSVSLTFWIDTRTEINVLELWASWNAE